MATVYLYIQSPKTNPLIITPTEVQALRIQEKDHYTDYGANTICQSRSGGGYTVQTPVLVSTAAVTVLQAGASTAEVY